MDPEERQQAKRQLMIDAGMVVIDAESSPA